MFGNKLVDPVALGAAVGAQADGAKGLELVEDAITGVLKVLSQQATVIKDLDFATTAHIAKGSFGGGLEAVNLAGDHTKAHAVIVTTLTDMITDLEQFQTAVIAARTLVRDADDDADAQIRTVLASTEQLDLGERAQADAQVEHRSDQPTDEPPATGKGDGR